MKITKSVTIADISYPVDIQGSGTTPCVCIGLGSLMQRTLSENFKQMFTAYSTDLYFVNDKLSDISNLTLQQIAEDFLTVFEQLNLVQPVILAHSCFGILALEMAKYDNGKILGLILVTSAPQWNAESIAQAECWSNNGGEELYHASLSAAEYQQLLTQYQFEVILHKVQDSECGGHTVWVSRYLPFN